MIKTTLKKIIFFYAIIKEKKVIIYMQRILIVEDDLTSRLLIKAFLKLMKGDLEIIEATNGEEALRELELKMFNLVLLDIVMPIMNGKKFLKSIKSKTKFNHMSVIAITTDSSAKTEMFELGADDFILKPVKKEDLIKKVSKRLLLD